MPCYVIRVKDKFGSVVATQGQETMDLPCPLRRNPGAGRLPWTLLHGNKPCRPSGVLEPMTGPWRENLYL